MPVAIKKIRQIPYNKLSLIILSGLLGSFFPAFLFCIAETKIDSSLTGILNACTPIFTIITGALFFKSRIKWHKVVGILVGFIGLTLLFLSKGDISLTYISFSSLVLLATVFYGVNVNMVSRYLKEVGSLNIASFAFALLTIPSFLILLYTGYFNLPLSKSAYLFFQRSKCRVRNYGNRARIYFFLYACKKSRCTVRLHGNLWHPLRCRMLGIDLWRIYYALAGRMPGHNSGRRLFDK